MSNMSPRTMTARGAGTEDGVAWVTCDAPFPPAVNGYALLPEGHPWRTLDLQWSDAERVQVHGGITYGPDPAGWIGFDYLHSSDYWEGSGLYRFPDASVRSAAEVEDEARSLAKQIAAAA